MRPVGVFPSHQHQSSKSKDPKQGRTTVRTTYCTMCGTCWQSIAAQADESTMLPRLYKVLRTLRKQRSTVPEPAVGLSPCPSWDKYLPVGVVLQASSLTSPCTRPCPPTATASLMLFTEIGSSSACPVQIGQQPKPTASALDRERDESNGEEE